VTAHPARDGTLVTDLVTRASTGDQQAWDALVERYAPLIWSICGRYRLGRADAEDVGQSVWLRLAGQLELIRDPTALPGWLATTTSRECGRVLRTARGPHVPVHALAPGTFRTSRPAWPTRNCSRLSVTRLYAAHSAACRRTASG
jgi:DNA-directed RNA polymerase specialized sigma24 family protein